MKRAGSPQSTAQRHVSTCRAHTSTHRPLGPEAASGTLSHTHPCTVGAGPPEGPRQQREACVKVRWPEYQRTLDLCTSLQQISAWWLPHPHTWEDSPPTQMPLRLQAFPVSRTSESPGFTHPHTSVHRQTHQYQSRGTPGAESQMRGRREAAPDGIPAPFPSEPWSGPVHSHPADQWEAPTPPL